MANLTNNYVGKEFWHPIFGTNTITEQTDWAFTLSDGHKMNYQHITETKCGFIRKEVEAQFRSEPLVEIIKENFRPHSTKEKENAINSAKVYCGIFE